MRYDAGCGVFKLLVNSQWADFGGSYGSASVVQYRLDFGTKFLGDLMKRAVLALLCMSLVPAYAQQVKDAAVAVEETEAMVTVTKVDKEKRTVTFEGPKAASRR